MALPVTWTTLPLDIYRGLLVSLRDSAPASERPLYVYHLKELDSGATRLVASGPSGFAPWTGTMVFEVDAGDASLDAAVARWTSSRRPSRRRRPANSTMSRSGSARANAS